ncbi:MAG: carbohydrate porin [Burkholderiales bacterium]|nr:carbohydrate porin [Burkholderiales bacterium]
MRFVRFKHPGRFGAAFPPLRAAVLIAGVLPVIGFARAQEAEDRNAKFQATYVWQGKRPFGAVYSGPNSLSADKEKSYSFTATAALGFRLSSGSELYFNHQLAGVVDRRRLVLTVGKLSVLDVFDDNAYSHDPRTQFLNWSIMTHGAYDYAADARGYSAGFALEYFYNDWAMRFGRFAQPKEPNQLPLDYRPETIFEAFYNLSLIKGTWVSVDWQHIRNPAYNADRGPVNVGSLRLHTAF